MTENPIYPSVVAAPHLGVGWVTIKSIYGDFDLKWRNAYTLNQKEFLFDAINALSINGLVDDTFMKTQKNEFRKALTAKEISTRYSGNTENLAYVQTHRLALQNNIALHAFGPKLHSRALAVVLAKYFYPQHLAVRKLATFRNRNGRLGVDIDTLVKIEQSQTKVDVTLQDGLENILPLVVFHGKTAQELRKYYGKSLWKVLSNQSLTANKRVAKFHVKMENNGKLELELLREIVKLSAWKQESFLYHSERFNWQLYPQVLSVSLKIFTHLFDGYTFSRFRDESYSFGLSENFSLWRSCNDTLFDSYRLIGILNARDDGNRKLKSSLSFRKIKDFHDDLIRENNMIRAAAIPKAPFPNGPGHAFDGTELNGYTFTLLKNEYELFCEGSEMHHCIHGYTEDCMRRGVICFSVYGPERASVAFRFDSKNNCSIVDLELRFTDPVSDRLFQICKTLAKQLSAQARKLKKSQAVAS